MAGIKGSIPRKLATTMLLIRAPWLEVRPHSKIHCTELSDFEKPGKRPRSASQKKAAVSLVLSALCIRLSVYLHSL